MALLPGWPSPGFAQPRFWAELGLAWPSLARPCLVWLVFACPGLVRLGATRRSLAQRGPARPSPARPGLAWPGAARPGPARPGPAWPGPAWPGLARPGLAQPGPARPGLAWPGRDGMGRDAAGRGQTPDAGRRTPDAGCQTPDAGRRTPAAGPARLAQVGSVQFGPARLGRGWARPGPVVYSSADDLPVVFQWFSSGFLQWFTRVLMLFGGRTCLFY